MNCSGTRRKLAAFSDGGLDPAAKNLVSRHLDSCPECRQELAQLKRLDAELDQFEEIETGPYFATRVRQRIADRRGARRSWWFGRLAVPAGAAAAMLFAAVAGIRLGRSLYDRGFSASSQTMIAASETSTLDLLDGPGGSFYVAGGSDE